VFYVFPYAEGFADDSEVDFCCVVRCDYGCWVGFTIEIPAVRISSCDYWFRKSLGKVVGKCEGFWEGRWKGDTMSRSVPSIGAYGRFCLVLRPKGLVGATRKRRWRYCLEVFD